jgi:lipopolysaccharide export system permease protein
VILELIGLGALQNLSVIMPIGLLLGIVLAFGRLYHDSEIAAALACGVGPAVLYRPIVLLTLAVTLAIAWLTLDIAPGAIQRSLELRGAALQAGQFAPIAPGRFRTFGGGDAVVYAEKVNEDGTLANVFVERDREGRVEVALAKSARHAVSPDGLTHTITLYDGERFEGTPGSPRFRIVKFGQHFVPVQVPKLTDSVTSLEAIPTYALLESPDPEYHAEFHWRVALPTMCIVLTIIALPLSRLRPREGRFARVWLAVLIYFVYSTLVSAAKSWLARGTVPEFLGLWWVHIAVLLLAFVVLLGPPAIARLRYRTSAA